MTQASPKKYAYSTLITKASYLPGLIVLAYTLRKQGSIYPLVVYYTPGLSDSATRALQLEASKSNLTLRLCDLLLPPNDNDLKPVAKRFRDTWTKLRVFDLFEYDLVGYLDADMMILKDMDPIFDQVVMPRDHIAVCHDCVCNPDKNAWSPEDWNPENCAYTAVSHPEALRYPIQPTPQCRPTYHAINSGLFLYHPSQQLWEEMYEFFSTTNKLESFKCPDQDFLAHFFYNRWISMPWQYNARKTMRYRHTNIWRDNEVVCLHYIVDKPWTARVGEDGVAGYKGEDAVTHQWWWDQYNQWEGQREREGEVEIVNAVRQEVADGDGNESNDEDSKDIGVNLFRVTPTKITKCLRSRI